MNRNVWKNVSGVRAERFEKLYSCVNTHCAVHISIHMHWQPTKKNGNSSDDYNGASRSEKWTRKRRRNCGKTEENCKNQETNISCFEMSPKNVRSFFAASST